MATNPVIDDELLARALEIGGEKSKEATVNRAQHELVARRQRQRILELFGTLDWASDFDYKRERTRS